jgi:hypothetical protein
MTPPSLEGERISIGRSRFTIPHRPPATRFGLDSGVSILRSSLKTLQHIIQESPGLIAGAFHRGPAKTWKGRTRVDRLLSAEENAMPFRNRSESLAVALARYKEAGDPRAAARWSCCRGGGRCGARCAARLDPRAQGRWRDEDGAQIIHFKAVNIKGRLGYQLSL